MEKVDLSYIRDFLIKGEVKKALEELFNILQQSHKLQRRLRDDVVLYRSKLNELERKENLNLISSEAASLERARLQKGILDVINALEEPRGGTSVFSASAGRRSGKFLYWAIPLVLVLLAMVFFIPWEDFFSMGSEQEPDKELTGEEPGGSAPAGTEEQAQLADLALSDWQFTPATPAQNKPVKVALIVHNQGKAATGNFQVEWWAGVNFPGPEKTWTLSLAPGEEQELTYNYGGYSSWYGQLQTKVVLDPDNVVEDADRSNNERIRTISVQRSTLGGAGKADLSFVGWRFQPSAPVQGQRTVIEFSIENKGNAIAENFSLQWWAGVNFRGPQKTWSNITLRPNERKDFRYEYEGYKSWYAQMQTKLVLDPARKIDESDRSNNEWVKTIRVRKSAN